MDRTPRAPRSTAAPGEAVCPHCQVPASDAPRRDGALFRCLLMFRCEACGGEWDEVRAIGKPARRFWEPKPSEGVPA